MATPVLDFHSLSRDSRYVNLATFPRVLLDLRYASLNNFMRENIYGDFKTAYLHQVAAKKFLRAIQLLEEASPDHPLRFLIFDALRPLAAQWKLWNKVKGTPQQDYIANPEGGSLHNFGMAIDLTLVNESGRELDMGTGFDDFAPLAQPALESKFLREGALTGEQFQNRLLLRRVLEGAGFIQFPLEWWHFDALPGEEIRGRFPLIG